MRISVVETLRIGRVLVLVLLDSSAWILAVMIAVALRSRPSHSNRSRRSESPAVTSRCTAF